MNRSKFPRDGVALEKDFIGLETVVLPQNLSLTEFTGLFCPESVQEYLPREGQCTKIS